MRNNEEKEKENKNIPINESDSIINKNQIILDSDDYQKYKVNDDDSIFNISYNDIDDKINKIMNFKKNDYPEDSKKNEEVKINNEDEIEVKKELEEGLEKILQRKKEMNKDQKEMEKENEENSEKKEKGENKGKDILKKESVKEENKKVEEKQEKQETKEENKETKINIDKLNKEINELKFSKSRLTII